MRNILNISRSFTEIIIIHRFKHRNCILRNCICCEFSIYLIIFNHRNDL